MAFFHSNGFALEPGSQADRHTFASVFCHVRSLMISGTQLGQTLWWGPQSIIFRHKNDNSVINALIKFFTSLPPANAGDARYAGLIPGSGRSLGQEMATHSSILAWKIAKTEEPNRLQSVGSQRVGHDWAHIHKDLQLDFQPYQQEHDHPVWKAPTSETCTTPQVNELFYT